MKRTTLASLAIIAYVTAWEPALAQEITDIPKQCLSNQDYVDLLKEYQHTRDDFFQTMNKYFNQKIGKSYGYWGENAVKNPVKKLFSKHLINNIQGSCKNQSKASIYTANNQHLLDENERGKLTLWANDPDCYAIEGKARIEAMRRKAERNDNHILQGDWGNISNEYTQRAKTYYDPIDNRFATPYEFFQHYTHIHRFEIHSILRLTNKPRNLLAYSISKKTRPMEIYKIYTPRLIKDFKNLHSFIKNSCKGKRPRKSFTERIKLNFSEQRYNMIYQAKRTLENITDTINKIFW